MRTILNLLTAIFIFSLIAEGCINKVDTTTTILIQPADKNVSSASLSQSSKIISDRLKSFNSEKFEITVLPEKNQIQITLTGGWDVNATENLLTQKGNLEFYETYNYKNLLEFLDGNDHLFSLLNATHDSSSAEIGCTSVAKIDEIDEYLNTINLNYRCKFAWNRPFGNTDACLYLLKLSSGDGISLGSGDIETVKFSHDKTMNLYGIEIEFKKAVARLWSDMTHRNMDRSIAIVLDNNVIYAPVVRSVIDNGKCSITGNFTESQVKNIVALMGNGELPVSFTIVK